MWMVITKVTTGSRLGAFRLGVVSAVAAVAAVTAAVTVVAVLAVAVPQVTVDNRTRSHAAQFFRMGKLSEAM
jgi:hypothetical protein